MVTSLPPIVKCGGNVIDAKKRLQLKAACDLFGGQKAVALATGIDKSNLGKWIQGGPTLSEQNVEAVLDYMGLPNGAPETSIVHVWEVYKVRDIDFTQALKPYFPDGGKIGKSAWAFPDLSFEISVDAFRNGIFIYAMKSNHVRAILRHKLKYNDDHVTFLKSHLEWRHGDEQTSQLRILEKIEKWTAGALTPLEFDYVWQDVGLSPETQRVITAFEAEGISPEEAVRRIQSGDR